MSERPILFSAPTVRAILEGRKTLLLDTAIFVALLSCLVLFALLMVRTHSAAVKHQLDVNERQDALTLKALNGGYR